MAGKARRACRAYRPFALRLERLEIRALLSSTSLTGSGVSPPDPARSLLVRFDAGTSTVAMQAALKAARGTIVQSIPSGPNVVEFSSVAARSAALGRLRANPVVAYAEPDAMVQASALIPNDPLFSNDWGLNGGNNIDIDAPEAWSISTGSSAIIVAVIDTGVDLGNPDLSNRLWTNPTANSDGFTGDVHGYNFVNNTGNIQDDNGHGSHVTGILAAAGNDGTGIAGVDWNAQIMPLKTLGADGTGSTSAAAQAIVFAVNHGARVISASWGGPQNSQTLLNAISYANSKGVVFVTAAGNTGANNDLNGSVYPAAYRLPNELVVAAVDQSGNLASFSDYGASTVDVAAPGVNIFSTVPGGYQILSGTSMATPYVAGVVSLLAGQDPGLGATQLIQRVIATVKPLPSLAGRTVSGGMVDAYNALTNTQAPQAQTLSIGGGSAGTTGINDVETSILATDATYQAFGGTPTSYVTGLYQAIFGRAPDPTGLAYYAGQISSGEARQDVIRGLLGYDEARRTEVARWYQVELGWNAPLADLKVNSGVMYWASLIDAGQGDVAVHAKILAAGIAAGGGGGEYVTGLFQAALGRPADPGGQAYYTGQIGQGSSRYDIALALVTSDEGRRTGVARFYQAGLGWPSSVPDLKANPGVAYWAGLIGGS
jgi:thermitase